MVYKKLLSYSRIFLLLWMFNIAEADYPLGLNCNHDQFECLNNKCVPKGYYCDGGNDCGDNSDEQYCNIPSQSCPTTYPLYKCKDSNRCIPVLWVCDGTSQCRERDDEFECESRVNLTVVTLARYKAVKWISRNAQNRKAADKWGPQVHRNAVALYLGNPNLLSLESQIRKELAYELTIQFLWKLYSRPLRSLPTSELALFINAFIVTCLNPRKFYGMNLVKELRFRVDSQNYTNPFVMLSLCNAGETLTENDVENLISTFGAPRREFWTDAQAYVIMALACASRHQRSSHVDMNEVKELTNDIKKLQFRNGTVVNFKTTALVMQALLSTEEENDEDNFDYKKALEGILRQQEPNGSFGNTIIDTYYALPLLRFASLINVSSDHCDTPTQDEESGLIILKNQVGLKWRIQYSLWIGDGKELERTIAIRIFANTSMYEVMESASDVDSKFRFQFNVKNGKPYIYSISGVQNDPETETFWYLYEKIEENISRIDTSPADYIPGNNAHVVMWYHGENM